MTKCDSDYVFIATTMTTITTMTSYGVCDADDANFHFGFVVNFMAIRRAMTFAFETRPPWSGSRRLEGTLRSWPSEFERVQSHTAA